MNFKKIALLAALTASFGAYAAADDEATPAFMMADGAPAAFADAAVGVITEIGAATLNATGAAHVVQEGNGSIAYIDQTTGLNNFAAVLQQDNNALGVVYQAGEGNRAAIVSTVGSAESVYRDAYDVTANALGADVNALATDEMGAVTLSATGNVAFINQTGDNHRALINQTGGLNFASVVQTAAGPMLAALVQTGDLNRAAIYQH